MIIWINGTFGVGKTTTAHALVTDCDDFRLFDPEEVGFMLTRSLTDQHIEDFQDLSAWRALVPVVAQQLSRHTGQSLIAVQSVLRHSYWLELRNTFEKLDETILHVVLDADAQTLKRRIDGDCIEAGARQWRLDHIGDYLVSRNWMLSDADLVIDTRGLEPDEIARRIREGTTNLSSTLGL
ncbi:AAA family ATPase [Glutamicibacter endophyticus]|uniref:AAA family ATPase n=1 Tax=Glutamicibacter endophyticus TaxID=1522174 RepID=UPI003AF1061B